MKKTLITIPQLENESALELIVRSKLLKKLIDQCHCKLCYAEDLEQEILLILANKDESFLQELVNKKEITFYLVRIINNLYHSKTSPFYKTYRKYYELVDDCKQNNAFYTDGDKDDDYEDD